MAEISDLNLPFRGNTRGDDVFFSTDENDELVAKEKATKEKFLESITIEIDGQKITVPKAVPETDFLGNPVLDWDGLPKPRATTIFDAAKLMVEQGLWAAGEVEKRIPILCHQEHLDPVAVCRMCSVHVQKYSKRAQRNVPAPVLVPACHHEVQVDMIVTTRGGGGPLAGDAANKYAGDVAKSTRVLAELLLVDHFHPDTSRDARCRNELTEVAGQLGINPYVLPRRLKPNQRSRNEPEGLHPKSRRRIELPMAAPGTTTATRSITDIAIDDPQSATNSIAGVTSMANLDLRATTAIKNDNFWYSSPTVSVNHDRCILCDRCVRSCSDVKPFKVIGHTGKGYRTRISFDLDEIMDESNCVQCGECMNSCPTGALTLNRRILPKLVREELHLTDLTDPKVQEQIRYLGNPDNPLPEGHGFLTAAEVFAIEAVYLDKKGQKRSFKPFANVPRSYLVWNEGAVRERHFKKGEVLCVQGEYGSTAYILKSGKFEIWEREEVKTEEADGWLKWLTGRKAPAAQKGYGERRVTLGPEVTILGELGCMNHQARTTTIIAGEDSVCYELTRNMLDMVQRSKAGREVLDLIYTRNAVRTCLSKNRLFKGLDFATTNGIVSLLIANPQAPNDTATLARVEPGNSILAEGADSGSFYMLRLGTVKITRRADGGEVILANLSGNNYDYFGEYTLLEGGVRTASVVALDPVEAVAISSTLFKLMCAMYPAIEERLREGIKSLAAVPKRPGGVKNEFLSDYLNQGLYQGQNLFVLDLHSCTRCDECTRACADSHGDGFSRLLREGMRFGQYLVAASCRSCHKPYCMDGCPVDAIHRSGTDLQIKIDSHCITCGLCEKNCPYGAIQIPRKDEFPGRAVNCDKCQDLVPKGADPFCVAACPHGAAIRIKGPDLLARVRADALARV